MGAVTSVPGVSSGTIAFIARVYEELVNSLKAIDLEAIKLLFTLRLSGFWKKINGNFLIALLTGIITGILCLSRLMIFLLQHYPIQIWAFFFGLILMSSPLVLRSVKRWTIGTILAFALGAALTYTITILSPAQTPEARWIIFLSGALAICPLVIPGVSCAFILLLIGKYEYISGAFVELNMPVILTFVAGCFMGLALIVRALSWILKKYHSITIALFAGSMIGSLNKVWPWKEVLSYSLDTSGKQIPAFDRSIWPWDYLEKTGKNPEVIQAILLAALGVFIMVLIEKIANGLKTTM